jgi:uncharacterized membrane protein YbaN (DUF454 family)
VNGDARVGARRRQLDIAGGIAAVIGIIGIFVDRSLLPVWAFLILFGVTTVPERLIRWVRQRIRERRQS